MDFATYYKGLQDEYDKTQRPKQEQYAADIGNKLSGITSMYANYKQPTYFNPMTTVMPQNITQYGNDYQAEINKRQQSNPSDPNCKCYSLQGCKRL